MTKETANTEYGYDSVLAAAVIVDEAYADLLKASDALAKALEFNGDYVLRRVLPSQSDERRKLDRITRWVEGQRNEIEERLRRASEEAKKQRDRAGLMKKLNLTPEQKALLGIKD